MGIDWHFYKKLWILAVPIVLQSFLGSALNMIDTLMVGVLGEKEIAAVGIANQVFFFTMLCMFGICSGAAVFMAQFWGQRDIKNIRKMMGIQLLSVCGAAIIAALLAFFYPWQLMALFNNEPDVISLGVGYLRIVSLSYLFTAITIAFSLGLRSIGQTILPLIINIGAVLLNILGNYLFIFGNWGMPQMGVDGAALGTLIARFVEMVVLVAMVYQGKGVFAASLKEMFSISLDFLKSVWPPIVYVTLNEACWAFGMVMYAAAFGHINYQAMAAIQISNTVVNLFLVIIFGMAHAAAVIVGNQVGAGENALAKLYAKRILISSCLIGVVLSVLLALSTPAIANLFNVSAEVNNTTRIILYITAFILVVRIFNIVMIVGIFRGGGDAKVSFGIEAGTVWLVGVPLAFLGVFVWQMPIETVFLLTLAEEASKFILCLYRYISGHWVKNVIRDIGAEKPGLVTG